MVSRSNGPFILIQNNRVFKLMNLFICLLILHMSMLNISILCICLPIFGEKLYRAYVICICKTYPIKIKPLHLYSCPFTFLARYVNNKLPDYWTLEKTASTIKIQRNWKYLVCKTTKNKTKTEHSMCGHHFAKINTNNINKTWAFLQTTECKNRPIIVCIRKL